MLRRLEPRRAPKAPLLSKTESRPSPCCLYPTAALESGSSSREPTYLVLRCDARSPAEDLSTSSRGMDRAPCGVEVA
eukprot:scaffold334_cov241-Pinguiococcus_pyrenoidosus.AAC.80